MRVVRKPFAVIGSLGMTFALAAAVFAGGLGLGAGLASTGAQVDGEIQGCVNTFSGQLRIVDSDNQCTAQERPINWSQQGVGGILDIQIVQGTALVTTEDERNNASVRAVCPEGYRVIGGGAGRGPSAAPVIVDWYLDASRPRPQGVLGFPDSDGWSASFGTLDGENAVGTYGFFAEAICALTAS